MKLDGIARRGSGIGEKGESRVERVAKKTEEGYGRGMHE